MIKIKKSRFVAIIAAVIIGTLLVATAGFFAVAKINDFTVVKASSYEKMKTISKDYSKLYALQTEINDNGLWKVSKAKQMNAIYKGLFNSLDDQYSTYMTKSEAEEWNSYVNGTFYGIGISYEKYGKNKYIIRKVFSDSPAQSAGLKRGDVILKVNGKVYTDVNKVKSAMRGKEGSKVKVTYSRKSATKTVTMTRAEITEDSVFSSVLKGNIGYIWISSFSENTADEFKTELKSMENKNVKGLVIDIRQNGGGYTQQGIKIADMLLPECTITYVKDRDGKKTYYNSKESCTKLKYVLLVDKNTASTSEILASAIKDNKGGKLVGTTTFGKGIIQEEYTFKDGSAFKLTIQQYFSPDGHKIHKIGVKPDYQVKLKSGSTTDYQLKKAIQLLK
ncbi:S41 family peptidase [Aminicella lysinilytica]|uniref:Carboxyl-terminal processing protease n=1 Tax=Aminicella lysinilytica TaxID=433323 RepID=A0A4R6Q097_9FIRM|nr:S41 family peptidase [Aminicella lysinilytica]TDP54561.1 carboxyl-terminal processing protease [Aminicella lysinilytica]